MARGVGGQGIEIRGVVRDRQGGLVQGAKVVPDGPNSPDGQGILTDAEGRFRLLVKPGVIQLMVTASGFSPRWIRLDSTSLNGRLEIVLDLAQLQQEMQITAGLPELAPPRLYREGEIGRPETRDLGQFLRQQPELAAFRRGSLNFDPAVRGLRETQVAMIVDGTRTFAAGPGRMDAEISHVSPHDVEILHVVKGPYALTWGAGALSAIRVDTYRAPYSPDRLEFHGRGGLNYGSNGEHRDGHGRITLANRHFRLGLSHNMRTGSDYRAGNGEVVPGDYLSSESRWNLGVRLGQNSNLEYLGGFQQQDDLDYPGQMLDATYFITRSHSWEYVWQPVGTAVTEVSGQLYLNRKDHLMNNDGKPTARPMLGRVPPFALRIDYPTSSDTWGGRYHVAGRREDWQWKAGGDFHFLEQNARRYIYRRDTGQLQSYDIVWPDAQIDNQGIYAQLIHQRERWQAGGTVRLDLVQSRAGEVTPFFQQNTTGALAQREANLSAAFNFRYRLRPGWVLTLGGGRSVRTAIALERYSDRFPSSRFQLSAEFMGNPAIRPEKSWQFDLGSDLTLGGLTVQLDVFRRRLTDYITVLPDPALTRKSAMSYATVYRYINGTAADFYGGEMVIGRGLGRYVTLRGTLGYVWGEDGYFNEPIIGIQPWRGTVELEGHTARRRLRSLLRINLVDRQERVATRRFEQPTAGYATLDWQGSWELTTRIDLNLGVENIANRHYINHLNNLNPFTRQRIPEPGRNVLFGLAFRF
jgi:iron complex outermembrane receptor protein